MHCSNCNNTSTLSACGRCNSVSYCSRECQCAHWRQHKTACAEIVAERARAAKQYPLGAYANTQLRGYIGSLMAAKEYLGMGRGHAAVFLERISDNVYKGTITMVAEPPAEHMPGNNCIAFSYVCDGVSYTDHRYIHWKNCQEYYDQFKSHNVDIYKNKRTIAFVCDRVHDLRLVTV